MRAYLRDRFPALGHAPLVEARSSRYELTADTHFIAAQHTEHPNVWLVGGARFTPSHVHGKLGDRNLNGR